MTETKSKQQLRLIAAERGAKLWLFLVCLILTFTFFASILLLNAARKIQVIAVPVPLEALDTHQLLITEPLATNMSEKAISKDLSDTEKIDEMFVRFYIKQRLTIINDFQEMLFRWLKNGYVYLLSAPTVYAKNLDFIRNLIKTKKVDYIQNVEINDIKKTDNIWVVTATAYRKNDNQDIFTPIKYNILLTVGHSPAYRYLRSDFSNPTGFYVKDYQENEEGAVTNTVS